VGAGRGGGAGGRTTLTILAFNTAQVYRTRGQRLVKLGIRRLRRQSQPELGPSPVVIFLDDFYAVLAVEELLSAIGLAVRQGLLPQLDPAHRPLGPL
jgi:hypothetical protein